LAFFLRTNALGCFNKQDWHEMSSSSDFHYGSPSSFLLLMNGTLTYNISQDRIRLFQCCVGGGSHAMQDAITL